ncbi:MAG TPA: hypothetical protein PLB45_03935 [Bacilli bacterium]|nr:hypothetical protein [Bacilli bacterium]HPZ23617.1 hypothetical protein [Bacilli bacterium]HQC84002.1 hypothetical protein [Bacilli bacterium]
MSVTYKIGYKTTTDSFTAIQYDESLNLVQSKDIMDLVNFTKMFEDENELKAYLVARGLVDKNAHEFAYVKPVTTELGVKSLFKVQNTHIVYDNDVQYFTVSGISNYIIKNRYNYTFINQLCAHELKKNNIYSSIFRLLDDYAELKGNYNYLALFKSSLPDPKNFSDAKYTVNYNKLIGILEDVYVKGKVIDYTIETKINDCIFNIKNCIYNNPFILTSTYNCTREKINKNYAIINAVMSLLYEYNNHEQTGNDHSTESITRYVDKEICKRNPNAGNRPLVDSNNNIVINNRKLFDLGQFILNVEIERQREIQEYEEYDKYERSQTPRTDELESDNSDDEYLTEEDFIKLNEDPNEMGYKSITNKVRKNN